MFRAFLDARLACKHVRRIREETRSCAARHSAMIVRVEDGAQVARVASIDDEQSAALAGSEGRDVMGQL
jgi:hypothetical protein